MFEIIQKSSLNDTIPITSSGLSKDDKINKSKPIYSPVVVNPKYQSKSINRFFYSSYIFTFKINYLKTILVLVPNISNADSMASEFTSSLTFQASDNINIDSNTGIFVIKNY